MLAESMHQFFAVWENDRQDCPVMEEEESRLLSA